MIVGWQASRSLRTDLALDALEQAIWARSTRRPGPRSSSSITPTGACNISRFATPNGSPPTAIVNSVGSRGDRYDNALAETINGLYKTELVRNRGPWRGLDDLELATLEWVDWFNHRRLFEDHGQHPTRRVRSHATTVTRSSRREAETQTTRACMKPGAVHPPRARLRALRSVSVRDRGAGRASEWWSWMPVTAGDWSPSRTSAPGDGSADGGCLYAAKAGGCQQ